MMGGRGRMGAMISPVPPLPKTALLPLLVLTLLLAGGGVVFGFGVFVVTFSFIPLVLLVHFDLTSLPVGAVFGSLFSGI